MLEERVRREVLSRFPQGSVLEAELRAMDLPQGEGGAAGPGVGLELVPRGPEEHNRAALELAPGGRRGIPEAVYQRVVADFREEHAAALAELGRDLPGLVPEATHLSVRYGGLRNSWTLALPPERRNLTAVLVRLDPTDLETLDTLLAAGFATSRAEAVRWALARIREREAYADLRRRVGELEALKAQF
jgi:hypothetical protein